MSTILLSHSENETFEFGRQLARSLRAPVRILLVGDLGAGKTTLTRGLASGFGVEDPGEVSSPTFTLINRYRGAGPVFHVDLYRIGEGETHDLGLDDLLDDPASIVIIEWAERLGDVDLDGAYRIRLEYVDARTRRIEVED